MNRYIPYGYMMKDGQIVVNESEAAIIREMCKRYVNGSSYFGIAKWLTSIKEYYADEKNWNKNNVARTLANDKLIGADGYPEIISVEMFDKVQNIRKGKKEKWAMPNSDKSRILWKRLICAECGGRLLRIGGMLTRKGIVQIRCENPDCSNGHDISLAELYAKVADAMKRKPDECAAKQPQYEPSAELIKLENEVCRRIEKPSEPNEIRRLILQTAAVRYDCLQEPSTSYKTEYTESDRPGDIDWMMFDMAVSHISIGKDCSVTAQYK